MLPKQSTRKRAGPHVDSILKEFYDTCRDPTNEQKDVLLEQIRPFCGDYTVQRLNRWFAYRRKKEPAPVRTEPPHAHTTDFGFSPLTADAVRDLIPLWEATKWPSLEVIQIWARLLRVEWTVVHRWVLKIQTQHLESVTLSDGDPSQQRSDTMLLEPDTTDSNSRGTQQPFAPSLSVLFPETNPADQTSFPPVPFFHNPSVPFTPTEAPKAQALLWEPVPGPYVADEREAVEDTSGDAQMPVTDSENSIDGLSQRLMNSLDRSLVITEPPKTASEFNALVAVSNIRLKKILESLKNDSVTTTKY